MADDPDDLFPSGATTRRGLLTAFGRRAAQSLPDVPGIPEPAAPRPAAEDLFFDEEPPDRVEPILADDDLVTDVKASVEETGMHIWWLGQSGFLVQIAGESILVDPFLADAPVERDSGSKRIMPRVVDPALLSFVEVVACSNGRTDHLDPETLPAVLAENAFFVCAAGLADRAHDRSGRTPDALLATGDSVDSGGFLIHAVPAYHDDLPETVGFVVRNGAYALYFAGCTRRVQGMAETVAPFGVDAAIVPITGLNGIMNGADAARLAYESGAQIAIPCHYEMFRDDTAGVSRFVAECVRIGQEYRLPGAGERTTIDYGF